MTSDEIIECMEGADFCQQRALHLDLSRWELEALAQINSERPPSRICYTLPLSAYETKRLLHFCDLEL